MNKTIMAWVIDDFTEDSLFDVILVEAQEVENDSDPGWFEFEYKETKQRLPAEGLYDSELEALRTARLILWANMKPYYEMTKSLDERIYHLKNN